MTHGLLGRLPRMFNPRIPHFSALMAMRKTTLPVPGSADWTGLLPADLGMMANDRLGCCTCAAAYHARQVWTANASSIATEPDDDVIAFYSQATGYDPSNPKTDRGGCEQIVLSSWMHTGIPVGANGHAGRDKLDGFVEIDPRNLDDIKAVIAYGGVCYIGFEVPDKWMNGSGTWDALPMPYSVLGGHAVILVAYDAQTVTCITWGRKQVMTWAGFAQFTDEAYMLVDYDWIKATALSPGGLSIQDLEAQMVALKEEASDVTGA